MATLYTHQSSNIRKTWLIMSLFLIFVIGLGWLFSWLYQTPEILYIVVAIAFVQVFVSYWWSDKIVLRTTGAKEITRENGREIYNLCENLCIAAGLPVPKLYLIDDPVPNAFATGRDPKHAAVAVTTGLLKTLDRSELEGVIAHELAHIGNRDILVMSVVVVLVGVVTLLADIFLRFTIFGGGDRDRGGGQIQILFMVIGIILMILSPIIATLVQLAISRKREYLADASGALLTRYPEGLASALRKISLHSGKMKKANHATSHLFISDPFGKKSQKGWFAKMWQTHPAVEDRIAALANA